MMYLLQHSPLSQLHSPSSNKPPSPRPTSIKAPSPVLHTFDGSLLRLLRSLLVPAPPHAGTALSFSYLTRAAGVASAVHAGAGAIFADPSASGYDEAAIASYIGSSIKLLDVCNAVSAEIERLHLGRLLLVLAARLLSSSGGAPPPPDKVRKARESIREWEESFPKGRRLGAAEAARLVRDLRPRGPPPIGKATALGRAVYAVEAVSALVAGALLVAFLGGEVGVAAGTEVPPEAAWAKAFHELHTAISGEIVGASPAEMEPVKASVRKVADIMDGSADNGEEAEERLRSAVKELETATEEITESLDRLRGAVNALFRAVLVARNTALERFRLGPNKCKQYTNIVTRK